MWGYGPQYGMMMGGYGYGIMHMVFWAVVLIAVVVGIVWLVRSIGGSGAGRDATRRSPGLNVLEERYARGDINRDEYVQKKRDLLD